MNIHRLLCLAIIGVWPTVAMGQGFGTVINCETGDVHVAPQTGGNFGAVHSGYRQPTQLYYYYPTAPNTYFSQNYSPGTNQAMWLRNQLNAAARQSQSNANNLHLWQQQRLRHIQQQTYSW